jgi:hypothetical protein
MVTSHHQITTSRHDQIVPLLICLGIWLPLSGALSAHSEAPAEDPLVATARAYVEDFEARFVSVVSEERSEQDLRAPIGVGSVPSTLRGVPGGGTLTENVVATEERTRRRLRASYIIVRAETGLGWMPFRDVVEVDGREIPDRVGRLLEIFRGQGPADLEQARRLMDESARHNLGDTGRTLNIPVLGLLFLHPDQAGRVAFTYEREERVARRQARVFAFQETGWPTLVRGPDDGELPSRGRVWLEAGTGRILKTEHIVDAGTMVATVTVTYREEPALAMLVPDRMEEAYVHAGRTESLRVTATYTNYQRLRVTTDEEITPRKPPPPRSPDRSHMSTS